MGGEAQAAASARGSQALLNKGTNFSNVLPTPVAYEYYLNMQHMYSGSLRQRKQ